MVIKLLFEKITKLENNSSIFSQKNLLFLEKQVLLNNDKEEKGKISKRRLKILKVLDPFLEKDIEIPKDYKSKEENIKKLSKILQKFVGLDKLSFCFEFFLNKKEIEFEKKESENQASIALFKIFKKDMIKFSKKLFTEMKERKYNQFQNSLPMKLKLIQEIKFLTQIQKNLKNINKSFFSKYIKKLDHKPQVKYNLKIILNSRKNLRKCLKLNKINNFKFQKKIKYSLNSIRIRNKEIFLKINRLLSFVIEKEAQYLELKSTNEKLYLLAFKEIDKIQSLGTSESIILELFQNKISK